MLTSRPLSWLEVGLFLTLLLTYACDDEQGPLTQADGGTQAGQVNQGGQGGAEPAGAMGGQGGLDAGAVAGAGDGVVGGAPPSPMGGEAGGEAGAQAGETPTPVSSEDLALDGLDPSLFADFDQAQAHANQGACASLSFLYPEAGTVIPANLFGLTLQWSGEGLGPYLVTATAGGYTARWLTAQPQLTPEGVTWELLKSNSVASEVEWRLSVLMSEGRCDGGSTSIEVDPSELSGAVYYWSTGDMGIMRLAAGERAPEPLLTPAVSPELNCPACHALSRDGQRIAFTRTTFQPFGDVSASHVATPRELLYDPMGVEGYFPSFSPNAGYLVAGSSGRVVLRDSNTGQELNHLTLPEATVGGVPDWSWQGDRITAVVGPAGLLNFLPNEGINSGAIYEWVRVAGERGEPGLTPEDWGNPTLLVAQEGELSNDRPAYDPTGRMIAFNKEGSDPSAGEGMGNRNVSLWAIPVGQEGATPVELSRANQGELRGNSWPKWAPSDQRGRLWLAFSSFRDYGHILPDNANTVRRPQIWVTAIDPSAPPGADPSAPAFWLPFQDVNSGNHIPYWAAYEKR